MPSGVCSTPWCRTDFRARQFGWAQPASAPRSPHDVEVLQPRGPQLRTRRRHIARAGIPCVAQREPGNAFIRRHDRPIGRPRIGVVHRDGADVVRAKSATALDHHLILVGLDGSAASSPRAVPSPPGTPSDTARPAPAALARLQRVAVLTDEGGVPAVAGLAPRCRTTSLFAVRIMDCLLARQPTPPNRCRAKAAPAPSATSFASATSRAHRRHAAIGAGEQPLRRHERQRLRDRVRDLLGRLHPVGRHVDHADSTSLPANSRISAIGTASGGIPAKPGRSGCSPAEERPLVLPPLRAQRPLPIDVCLDAVAVTDMHRGLAAQPLGRPLQGREYPIRPPRPYRR